MVMVCIQCGATLRPQARFCNVCGAEQSQAESSGSQHSVPVAAPEQPLATTEATETTETTANGHIAEGAGKQKRPPRIPRRRDDDSVPGESAEPTESDELSEPSQSAEPSEPAESIRPEPTPPRPETATAVAEREPVEAVEPSERSETAESPESSGSSGSEPEPEIAEDEGQTLPEMPNAVPISEMPTQVHPVLTPMSSLPKAAPLDEPLPPYDLDEMPEQPSQPIQSTPADGLPWPLPPAIIVGGRYRIEELVRSSRTEHGPENVYRARDLQAYEQCWSCGARHDIATALDPYCDQCGADMLSREFVLIERLTSDTETALPPDAAISGEEEARVFTQGMRTYQVAPKAISAIHFPMGVHVSAYVTADPGRTRQGQVNEDSTALLTFEAIYDSRHHPYVLGIVADGLGGHDSGHEASKLVVRAMLEKLTPALVPNATATSGETSGETSGDDAPSFDGETLLRDAARAANEALCAANEAQGADMGSTLVVALIAGDMAWIANMGDSRGYVYDDHGLRRMTKDHSLVEQLIDAGMITPEERYSHPQRNQILKSLGADPRLDVDIFPQELRPGMRILLCSDGVWEMVRDDELARILRESASTAEAGERIVRAANENGGEDNISLVLIDASA